MMARKKKQEEFPDEEVYDDEMEEAINEFNAKSSVASGEQKDYNNTVKLVNKISARVKIPGAITGELYLWERAGAVVEVDERDAPGLLEKTLGGEGCCGSANKNYIFEVVK